ncbi:hypothetical protein [Jannaschia sp. CCS1]|uniref:hypothetical protein n=1 Tax=Jannaschia sp. (strain CCS1) TaxID=290400 RepID=UPI000053B6B0|nr:hypothetical protein [Jannaschia sp. CCS1]ABD55672.1 hypothetical protein Jann_2755 [Jannaschia sp. CCS1]
MDLFTVFVGFGSIGGLLAGYLMGRFASPISVLALWAICAAALIAYANWLDAGSGPDSVEPILVLYGVLMPFSACVIVASLIGTVVRKVLGARGVS